MATPAYGPAPVMACSRWKGPEAPGETVLHSFRSREGYTDGHLRFHGRTCDCADPVACIDPVVDYQKRAREVLSDSLRGRMWGLCAAL